MAKLDAMTVEEVMEFFSISKATVYKLVGAGRLPAPFRMGQRNLWLRSSIDKVVLGIEKKSESNLRYKGVI